MNRYGQIRDLLLWDLTTSLFIFGVIVFLVKKIGNKKKANKEKRWIKPPAISSSPNGPDSLLGKPTNPNISLPFTNWKIISIETNKTEND